MPKAVGKDQYMCIPWNIGDGRFEEVTRSVKGIKSLKNNLIVK